MALWDAGTVGIREENFRLIAGFADDTDRVALSAQFCAYQPCWQREEDIDWVLDTQAAWPGRSIGQRIYLAPVWNQEATPLGRVRVIHNPGMSSGTGEHPCTQLALEALETSIVKDGLVVDVGTGSGILATAALLLGAKTAVALDIDLPSLSSARENFQLNQLSQMLIGGSAECIRSDIADVMIANISGSVLLSLADEFLRIVKAGSRLILTGFPDSELSILQQAFGAGVVSQLNEWRCLTLRF